jgi:hypothetical protein
MEQIRCGTAWHHAFDRDVRFRGVCRMQSQLLAGAEGRRSRANVRRPRVATKERKNRGSSCSGLGDIGRSPPGANTTVAIYPLGLIACPVVVANFVLVLWSLNAGPRAH